MQWSFTLIHTAFDFCLICFGEINLIKSLCYAKELLQMLHDHSLLLVFLCGILSFNHMGQVLHDESIQSLQTMRILLIYCFFAFSPVFALYPHQRCICWPFGCKTVKKLLNCVKCRPCTYVGYTPVRPCVWYVILRPQMKKPIILCCYHFFSFSSGSIWYSYTGLKSHITFCNHFYRQNKKFWIWIQQLNES